MPPPTVGITVRLLGFQEPPSAKLVCFSPTSHLFVSVCSLRVRLFAPTRSKTFSKDASCRQLPVGSTPRQVLLSFPWRARLNCCRGQGQLGTRPQPGQVPWSGLVPSSSHQPGGGGRCRGRTAEVLWLYLVSSSLCLLESPRFRGSGWGVRRIRSSSPVGSQSVIQMQTSL